MLGLFKKNEEILKQFEDALTKSQLKIVKKALRKNVGVANTLFESNIVSFTYPQLYKLEERTEELEEINHSLKQYSFSQKINCAFFEKLVNAVSGSRKELHLYTTFLLLSIFVDEPVNIGYIIDGRLKPDYLYERLSGIDVQFNSDKGELGIITDEEFTFSDESSSLFFVTVPEVIVGRNQSIVSHYVKHDESIISRLHFGSVVRWAYDLKEAPKPLEYTPNDAELFQLFISHVSSKGSEFPSELAEFVAQWTQKIKSVSSVYPVTNTIGIAVVRFAKVIAAIEGHDVVTKSDLKYTMDLLEDSISF